MEGASRISRKRVIGEDLGASASRFREITGMTTSTGFSGIIMHHIGEYIIQLMPDMTCTVTGDHRRLRAAACTDRTVK